MIDEGPVINEPRLLRGEFDNRMCGAFFEGGLLSKISCGGLPDENRGVRLEFGK